MKQSSSKVVVYAALGLNAAIAVSKFVAAFFTGSAAIEAQSLRQSENGSSGPSQGTQID